MQLNVSAIRDQKGAVLPVEGEVPCPPLELEGDGLLDCGAVAVHGTVTNTGKGYLVKVRLKTRIKLECTRCLEPFTLPVERPIQEMFYPERLRGQKLEEDEVVNYYRDDILDLSEAIRENLQLALPMKRICRPDCRGLCPVCGRNLNEGECRCEQGWTDSRWAALKERLSPSGTADNGERKG